MEINPFDLLIDTYSTSSNGFSCKANTVVECYDYNFRHRNKERALDMHGHACADATRKFDLCDSCLYKVGKALDAAIAPPTSAEGVEHG